MNHPSRTPRTLLLALFTSIALATLAYAQAKISNPKPKESFKTVNRPGSVDLATEYDLSNLAVPKDQIHTLLPRDAIPALTDPELIALDAATYLNPDDRIIDVTITNNGTTQSVAVPLKILNFHEVANLTIAGLPIAATYCPLCDSVTVVNRTVKITPTDPLQNPQQDQKQDQQQDAHEEVLEFGVSGALYNSNVLMYDQTYKALWSQIGLKAISGPLAGTQLELLPVKIIPWSQYQKDHQADQSKPKVISINTGHDRPYDGNPYQSYFENQDYIMVPVANTGDALPKKTLGLGIKFTTENLDESFFVPTSAITKRFVINTSLGQVIAVPTKAGVQVVSAPQHVQTLQSFYYAYTAFHPDTKVLTESAE